MLAAASLALLRDPPKSAFAVALAFATVWLFPVDGTDIQTLRSFFGVHKIYESDDGRFRILKNGSTIHGAERIETEDGEAVSGRPRPITYYHDKSAMNRVIEAVRARKGGPLRTAVIGLGSGSLACRIASGETWRFFEIDPTIIDIARDPERFTFLSSCAPGLPIVLGDARLTFAQEPTTFTISLLSTPIPQTQFRCTSLRPRRWAIYKSKLSPQGVVMMHISNRHLELRSVVEGIAAANGLKTWIWSRRSVRKPTTQTISSALTLPFPQKMKRYGHAGTRPILGFDPAEPRSSDLDRRLLKYRRSSLAKIQQVGGAGPQAAALGGIRWFGVEFEILSSSSFISTPTSANSGVER